MAKHRFKLLALILLVAAGAALVYSLRGNTLQVQKAPVITTASSNETSTVDSPDGKMSLIMKQQKNKDATTYTFFVSNSSDGSQKQLFTKTVNSSQALSIPGNTWSPDNKYVFLKESSPTQADYFVVLPTGDTLDISDLFAKKYPDFTIADVTGWAAPTLVIINTNKTDGTQGPSFWFEVTDQAFIQLSSRFN